LITTLVTVLHVVVCVFLILVILLQAGKGGGGLGFGGGAAQTVFGGRGSQTFLGKVTSAMAAIFMITSLTLAYQSSKRTSLMEKARAGQIPLVPTAPAGGAAPFAPAPGPETPGQGK
jgi:preprotein translocase subunit SecG